MRPIRLITTSSEKCVRLLPCGATRGLPRPTLWTRIVEFFLLSPHIAMRRRAYKHLRRNWADRHLSQLYCSWQRTADPDGTAALIQAVPTDWLQTHYSELIPTAYDWAYRRLCMRLGADLPELLARLRTEDEISYLYVTAKLGKRVLPREAREIFERNRHDERLGLLLWCLGVHQHSGVLAEVIKRAEQLAEERIQLQRQRFGI